MSILRVESKDDFGRDVLKSDTAGVIIPELDLEVTSVSPTSYTHPRLVIT